MASGLERIYVENQTSFWKWKGADPSVDAWPLMQSPFPVLLTVAVYMYIITVGPKYMKNRKALNLDKYLLVYNAIQIFVAGRLAYQVIEKGIFKNGFLLAGCDYPSYVKDREILNGAWVYFITKISELLDTIFFVLRKKNNQITFLHVFHHTSMVLYTWGTLKYTAGGDGTVLAFLNCCVHVIMYSYYLLAGLGPRFQKFLWWKKYVTKIQLIQFILMLTHITYTQLSPKCSFSAASGGIIFFNITVYLIFFLKFYYESYSSKKVK